MSKNKSSFWSDFKKFITKGNVVDMAVGVVIGGAFKAIVDSLVADIINPILGMFGNQDLTAYAIKIGEASINYGSFLTAIINFIIMAFIIFVLIKVMNRMRSLAPHKEEAPAAPTTKVCPYCKSEIAIDATRCPHCTSEQP